MTFYISSNAKLPPSIRPERPFFLLEKIRWNDYSYTTLFQLYYFPVEDSGRVDLGSIKIMRLGQELNESTFSSEIKWFESLSELDEDYCSLGENLDYYENLKLVGDTLAITTLKNLNDVSYNANIRSKFEQDDCFNTSLLRYSEAKEALDKGASLFGMKIIRELEFLVNIRIEHSKKYSLSFNFNSYKSLPHRVNLLVGSNGVGKTQVMAKLAILLSRFAKDENENKKRNVKRLFSAGSISPRPSLYNIIAVSFNAFDNFELPTVKQTKDFNYSYCGLRKDSNSYYTEKELTSKIQKLITKLEGNKRDKAEVYLKQLLHYGDDEKITNSSRYSKLSAGQKIVLNILLHILSEIKPQSLILLDEPETHLHPKLMTSLFIIITEILEDYDSFAIIATHSPIIVQQIPSRSVHVLRRIDNVPESTRPMIECFGENLSEISRHVFQTSQSDRDYESVIDELLSKNFNDPGRVEEIFEGKLGMNARMYLRSKAALKEKD